MSEQPSPIHLEILARADAEIRAATPNFHAAYDSVNRAVLCANLLGWLRSAARDNIALAAELEKFAEHCFPEETAAHGSPQLVPYDPQAISH